jgi:hypothetical protein
VGEARNDNRIARLTCLGVSRCVDHSQALLVSFSRRLSDDELRFFHEVCQRSAPLMEDE